MSYPPTHQQLAMTKDDTPHPAQALLHSASNRRFTLVVTRKRLETPLLFAAGFWAADSRGSGSQSRLSPSDCRAFPFRPCRAPARRPKKATPKSGRESAAGPARRDVMSRRSRQTVQPVPAVQPVACYSLLLIPQPDKKGVIMSLLTESGGQHPVVRNQNEKNRTFSFRLLF